MGESLGVGTQKRNGGLDVCLPVGPLGVGPVPGPPPVRAAFAWPSGPPFSSWWMPIAPMGTQGKSVSNTACARLHDGGVIFGAQLRVIKRGT